MTNTREGGVANPQMPRQSPPSPRRSIQDEVNLKQYDDVGLRAGMPSWDDLRGNPHFKVGVIIESTSTNDRHIPSIAKPATPCTLSSVVIIHSGEEEDKDLSTNAWFARHHMQSEASGIIVGWGQAGLKELFASEVDAVYIIVPPGCVMFFTIKM